MIFSFLDIMLTHFEQLRVITKKICLIYLRPLKGLS